MSSFPVVPSEISVDWLRGQLRARGVDSASLHSVQTERIGTGLIGDSYRIALGWAGEPPVGAPLSLVAKLPASDPTSRAAGVGLGNYEREVRFYREVAETLPIRLATTWGAEWDGDDGSFLLLLEDLAPALVGDQLRGCSVPEAEAVMDMAARLHATHWDAPSLSAFGTWMSRPGEAERGAQLAMLWTMAWPQFVARHDHRLGADDHRVAERFGHSIALWANDRPGPKTLVHGDFRTDNMLFGTFDSATAVVPVDWQTPAIGLGVADVAYFVGASVLADDRRVHEERLVRRWFDGLGRAGVRDYTWTQCWEDYRRMTFTGVVMGVVASMLTPQTARGDDMFFAMASRHLAQVRDLDALSLLG
jgi:aminoglycoside phosphotransferase (APT) family kinase protein